ncbi:MAG: MFS transporter [Bacteroidota bacterium]
MLKNRMAVNAFFLVNGFIYANWVSRLPAMQETYGMDNGQTGLVLLAYAVGALVAMPFSGWLIVKNGSRKITVFSGLLFVAFVPFFPVMRSIELLTLLLLITGMSTGVMDVAMNAQAVLVEEKYGRPIMSSFHAVFSGGMMIGAVVGSVFTRWETSLFTHFSMMAIVGILTTIWASFRLINDQTTTTETEESGGFQLPAKALIGIGIIAFCCMLGEGAMADWSTLYMREVALAEAGWAPIGLGAFSSAMMLGRIFGDRGRVLFGDGKLLIINSLIALGGALVFVVFPIPLVVIIGLFLVGLGLSVIVPIAYSRAGAMPGLAPGVGISMVTTIGYSGFLFGPPIIGFIADWQTLRVAMIFVVLLFVIMTFLTVLNRAKSREINTAPKNSTARQHFP